MPTASTVHAPRRRLDWHAIKGDVSIEAVARALLGDPPGRGGRGLWWRCPFHDDRNPSFTVDAERGTWRCFGCGEHGDAADLAMKTEGLSFPEAVRRVAELCGLTPSSGDFHAPSRPVPAKAPERPEPGPSGLPREEAERVVVEAERALWEPEGAAALAHLRGRGLDDATIRSARLGYVDRLAVPARNDDRFFYASGIVVPWFDDDGRLRLVKVRQADGRTPKYAEAFRDSPRVFPSMKAIRPGLPLAIVEGEFDALLLTQLIGDLACVFTVGSASSRPGPGVLAAALACPAWFAAHDRDAAGDRAALPWLNFPWTTRVEPPEPAKDWCEAAALGFNVVRNHWRRFLRDGLPSWEGLETWRWGPALDREPPPLDAEPNADDERERLEERRAIAEADG